MKIAILIWIAASLMCGNVLARRTNVRAYTKKNGTHVSTHKRSSADHTKSNNYSSKGNMNPYTGKAGTK